jgi:hypothetical protein
MRIRLLWYFTRKIAVTNILVSTLATLLMQTVAFLYSGQPAALASGLPQASLAALTVGFLLSIYVHFLVRRHELPMYYNHGLRASACIGVAYGLHAAVFLPVLALGWSLRG